MRNWLSFKFINICLKAILFNGIDFLPCLLLILLYLSMKFASLRWRERNPYISEIWKPLFQESNSLYKYWQELFLSLSFSRSLYIMSMPITNRRLNLMLVISLEMQFPQKPLFGTIILEYPICCSECSFNRIYQVLTMKRVAKYQVVLLGFIAAGAIYQ